MIPARSVALAAVATAFVLGTGSASAHSHCRVTADKTWHCAPQSRPVHVKRVIPHVRVYCTPHGVRLVRSGYVRVR